jgi:hypothetical protein
MTTANLSEKLHSKHLAVRVEIKVSCSVDSEASMVKGKNSPCLVNLPAVRIYNDSFSSTLPVSRTIKISSPRSINATIQLDLLDNPFHPISTLVLLCM